MILNHLLTMNRFYLLTPHKECISVFSSPLNAGILTDRLKIFSVIVNIFRVLRTLEGFVPADTYPLYLNIPRANGINVGNLTLS
jgi:hypothetical protein